MPKRKQSKQALIQSREIKAFLARNGLSQARAAEIMGMWPQHMSLKVNGQYPFNVDELTALFNFIGGIDPEEMVRTFFPKVKILRKEDVGGGMQP